MNVEQKDITVLLDSLNRGDDSVIDDLFQAVYAQLRQLAHSQRKSWSDQNTLNTTALVHEAYLKLVDQKQMNLANRGHFFATAARAMRHILINYAKRRQAAKRGGKLPDLPLDEARLVADGAEDDLLALDEALDRLAAQNERQSRVVECRFFGGLNIEETAEALTISPSTVKRDWAMASAWLYRELSSSPL